MKSLTKEKQESYENAKICYICKYKFENKYLKDKKHRNVRDHCHYTGEYRGAAHRICNLKYSVPKIIAIVFHNGSNYDYHFIIKELAEEFEKQFICLGENTEKYITFTVPIEKEVTRIDKNRGEITKNILHILQFIDSAIIFPKEFIELNVNPNMIVKYVKLVELNMPIAAVFLIHKFKDDLIEYKCLCCNKNYQHKFD